MSDQDAERSRRKSEVRAKLKARAERLKQREAEAKARIKAVAEAAAQARDDAKRQVKAAADAAAQVREDARREAKSAANTSSDLTGRQRLIDAALRLNREKRSFASLGIREIAREANLNPNTFYRHFESLDDLAVATALQVGDRLRPMLRQFQRLASRVDPVTVAALEVSAFFAFVSANPDFFVVGVTEYHGGSARVRETIGGLLDEVAAEMADDIAALGIFSTISREHLGVACRHIVVHLFHLAQEYVEKPEGRAALLEASESMIVWMFAGAALGSPANLTALFANRPPA